MYVTWDSQDSWAALLFFVNMLSILQFGESHLQSLAKQAEWMESTGVEASPFVSDLCLFFYMYVASDMYQSLFWNPVAKKARDVAVKW